MIFDCFDGLCETFRVQKVRKTVNESYMVAAGLPDRDLIADGKERALAMAALAFSMVHVMDVINSQLRCVIGVEMPRDRGVNNGHSSRRFISAVSRRRPYGISLSTQIGIHSGAAIAGIIGHKRFQYDLCGDAVNTAARMCSYSAPGCITISEATHALICDEYDTLHRGEKVVKGKGRMRLFFLLGRASEALREQQAQQRRHVLKLDAQLRPHIFLFFISYFFIPPR